MHWEILSDTFISTNKSDKTELSIDIWHFKNVWCQHYRPYSIYWSGSPECRPYARIISTKIVAFLLPSSINFIIHESNHHLPRTVMVPTHVKITTDANDISWTFYLSPCWMSELVLWSLLRVFITTSRYYNRFICFHFDWSCYHPLSYSIDLFKYHVYYWYFWYDIWRTASR